MSKLEKTKERGQGGMVGGNLIDPGLKTVVSACVCVCVLLLYVSFLTTLFKLSLLTRKQGTA